MENNNKSHLDFLKVGTSLNLGVDCMGNMPGDSGFCYHIETISGRRTSFFIFENGRFDGFSDYEIKFFFHLYPNKFIPELAEYKFTNVIDLHNDFEKGIFDKSFNENKKEEA